MRGRRSCEALHRLLAASAAGSGHGEISRGRWRIVGISGLTRGGPALVAALAVGVATLAGAGQAAAAAHPGAAGVISTVAGGVGGPGQATRVGMSPCGVSFTGGHVYIGAGSAVREVNSTSDWLTTPVGPGSASIGGGNLATRATLAGACSVGFDQSGNLVIADTGHERIRVVAASTGTFYGQAMTARHIYNVVDTTGRRGFSGDGGPATSAKLDNPGSVAVDGAGHLVIADTDNSRVRVVAASTGTFYGQAMTAGDIYAVAGGGDGGLGDGGPATSAELSLPTGVA